jgi:hypothetical protein
MQGQQTPSLQESIEGRLVARFGVKCGEAGVMQAVPADEIDHEEHQERAANHNGDGYLQAKLKVAGVGDFSHKLWP